LTIISAGDAYVYYGSRCKTERPISRCCHLATSIDSKNAGKRCARDILVP
jgi:hypothetical protein